MSQSSANKLSNHLSGCCKNREKRVATGRLLLAGSVKTPGQSRDPYGVDFHKEFSQGVARVPTD
jgi:hypothetical protein